MYPPNPAASKTCKALAASALTIFPGIIDPNVPTFLTEWDGAGAPYISFTHFNGNTFNVSGLSSYVSSIPMICCSELIILITFPAHGRSFAAVLGHKRRRQCYRYLCGAISGRSTPWIWCNRHLGSWGWYS